jgi:parallel beta-helix repeat protein
VVAATTIDGGGVWSVVSFRTGEGTDSVLAGFTITNGVGVPDVSGAETFGGGVLCYYGGPTIEHNVVTGNQADRGGGVFCYRQNPTISANTISGNSATYGAGVHFREAGGSLTDNLLDENSLGDAVLCWICSPLISGNTVAHTRRAGPYDLGGPGIRLDQSSPTITDNTINANEGEGIVFTSSGQPLIEGNRVTDNGAVGVSAFAEGSHVVVIRGNTITGNAQTSGTSGGVCVVGGSILVQDNLLSANHGSGIQLHGDADTLVSGNTITGNVATFGAGVEVSAFSGGIVRNNLIAWNDGGTASFSKGAGVFCKGGADTVLTNNTIAFNKAGDGSNIWLSYHTAVSLTSCIIAFGRQGEGIYDEGVTYASISHCDVFGNEGSNYDGMPDPTGTNGNISEDPLLADPDNGDFHLRSLAGRWNPLTSAWVTDAIHSPCIDAGDPIFDYSYEPLPNGLRVNMGAYGNTDEASKSMTDRPDLMIRNDSETSYTGNNVYSANGAGETKAQTVLPGAKARYCCLLYNDGPTTASFKLTGPAAGSGWGVRYYVSGHGEQTTAFTTTGYAVPNLAPGKYLATWFDVYPIAGHAGAATQEVLLRATSDATPTDVDAVKAVTTGAARPDLLVKGRGDTSYIGDGIYNGDGTNQTKCQSTVPGSKARYNVLVYNDGAATGSLKLTGPAAGTGWVAKYYAQGQGDQTTAFTTTGYTVSNLAVGKYVAVWFDVYPLAGGAGGSTQDVLVTAASIDTPANVDAVKGDTTWAATPDLMVKTQAETSYTGDGVYKRMGPIRRRARARCPAPRPHTASCFTTTARSQPASR